MSIPTDERWIVDYDPSGFPALTVSSVPRRRYEPHSLIAAAYYAVNLARVVQHALRFRVPGNLGYFTTYPGDTTEEVLAALQARQPRVVRSQVAEPPPAPIRIPDDQGPL